MEERVIPFSNGTEYQCWNDYNCARCKKYNVDDSGMVVEPVCQIDEALLELSEDDIQIDAGECGGAADGGENVPEGMGTPAAADR
jgi:5-methylcytosine-specific restriction endonuclease McrA